MSLYDSGILMTNGFSIATQKPADLKFLADTISDRDKYVTNNLAYEGMLVYVKATKKTYQYLNNSWEEFGFNQDKFEKNLYNGLDSESSILALTAKQGKVLNDKIITHGNNTTVHITATERTTWNAKASTAVVSTTTNGLMSKDDKVKLDGIATNANKYIHPSTHPATMITEDITHRFVTDEQIIYWNDKASTNVATSSSNGLMSSTDKTKLDGIATNANNYVHPNNANTRHVTDSQISTWNAKANTSVATQTANGLMSSTDKVKLDGIASGANNYTHPSTHPATIIIDDATHRFVTDTEKSTWNAKATTDVVTGSKNGLMISTDKTKLDGIDINANNYVHPNNANTRHVTDAQISTWNAKASTSVATQTANGLMSSTDKAKLDGISSGANTYIHPSTHPATMITEDTTHRFVTDTEKSTWNAKATTDVVSTTANGLMSKEDKVNLDSAMTRIKTLETNYNTLLSKVKTAVFWDTK